jgi:ribonuclease P protein component
LKRELRLSKKVDFERVRRSGKSYAHPLLVLIALPNDLEKHRIGVSAGRSVGGAVQRNRAKRRIRAIVNEFLHELEPGWDIVFLARKPLPQSDHPTLLQAIRKQLQRANLLIPR